MAKSKRVNRTDLTLRNLHALKRKVSTLDQRVDELEQRVTEIVGNFNRRLMGKA